MDGRGGQPLIPEALDRGVVESSNDHRAAIMAIHDRASLAAVARIASDAGRLALITTRHLIWALTGLNAMLSLRSYGFNGVLLVTNSETECERVVGQTVVRVRVCAWSSHRYARESRSASEFGRATQAMALRDRVWMLAELTRLRYQVLMVDSDVCFYDNPFPKLEQQNRTLILHGGVVGFNLGVLYADGWTGGRDLGLLHVAAARMEELWWERRVWNRLRRGPLSSQVDWDQGVVNDVLQEWVSGVPCIVRTCARPFAAGSCFWRCCADPSMEGARNESAAWAVGQRRKRRDQAAIAASQTILATSFGGCDDRFGVVHLNTCGRRWRAYAPIATGGPQAATRSQAERHRVKTRRGYFDARPAQSKLEWLSLNCWHQPLTPLAAEWKLSTSSLMLF